MQHTTNHQQTPFAVNAASVKKWIEELPLGSTGETTKQIYRAVHSLNKQEIPLKHRLDFLELIVPVVLELFPRLTKHFTNVSLPLNNKTASVVNVTSALMLDLIKSYQTLIKTLLANKPFGWKKPFSLSLHRSLIIYGNLLHTHQTSYQPLPKGVWHGVYWCYSQSEKYGFENRQFPPLVSTETKTSIQHEFTRILLLSLLSPSSLSHKNMRDVNSLMPLWINNAIISTTEPADKKTCYTLNLLSDSAPYLIGTRNDHTTHTAERRYLSTLNIQNKLNGYLNRLGHNQVMRLGNIVLDREVISVLQNNWTRNKTRKQVRKPGKGFVDIIAGITPIHSILSQTKQPAHDVVSNDNSINFDSPLVIDFEQTLTIEPLVKQTDNSTLNLSHFLSHTEQEKDIWEQVYEYNKNEVAQQHWTESTILKNYSFSKSQLIDYSQEGYRLIIDAESIESLKHNDLVATREHALAPWALSHIRWLHYSPSGKIQFGLKVLSHQVLPVNIRFDNHAQNTKPLPCLLGIERNDLLLFVPTLPSNLQGKSLHLEHNSQHTKIELSKKLYYSPGFDVYSILEISASNQLEHARLQSTRSIGSPQKDIESEFHDSIWNSF